MEIVKKIMEINKEMKEKIKQREKESKRQQEEDRRAEIHFFKNIVKWPGSLEEYEIFKGYQCEIIGVINDVDGCEPRRKLRRELYKSGVEAIIRYPVAVYGEARIGINGLSVRKKQKTIDDCCKNEGSFHEKQKTIC